MLFFLFIMFLLFRLLFFLLIVRLGIAVLLVLRLIVAQHCDFPIAQGIVHIQPFHNHHGRCCQR